MSANLSVCKIAKTIMKQRYPDSRYFITGYELTTGIVLLRGKVQHAKLSEEST